MSINNVATPCAAYQRMKQDWALVDALWGGTKSMREAGETFLPKRKLETKKEYDARLALATLYPAFAETVQALTARAFSAAVNYGDVMPWIKHEVLPDIDMQGHNGDTFARDWFELALRKGLAHVLVEAPVAQAASMAEQKALKLRPYTVLIDPLRVIGWKQDADGQLVQARVMFDEEREDPDNEFATKTVKTIRVYEPARVRTFVQDARGEWQQESVAVNNFGFVPLATMYLNRTGFMQAKPPLMELAFLNSKHWRLQVGIDSLVDIASVPILVSIGGGLSEDNDEVVIGAKHALELPLGADLKYVEHTGAAIKTGTDSLGTLKEDMRQAGAKLLLPQGGASKTEEQSREENARENSRLGMMVKVCEDTLEILLDMIASTRGQEVSGGEVTMQPNLSIDFSPNESMKVVLEMFTRQLIDSESTFEEAKRRGLINENLTWDEVQVRVREEFGTVLNNITNLPPPGASGQQTPADPANVPPAPAPGGLPAPQAGA